MNFTDRIEIPERGRSPILDPATWAKLESSSDFWQLSDHYRVKVLQHGPKEVQLGGYSYVGRAQIGDVLLEVTEKIDGALKALLSFATHDIFRIENASSPMSEMGELAVLLVGQFLSAVRRYASEGRDFRYSVQSGVGSLIGGRINVTKTLSLRARGLRHLAAFDRNVILRNTPKNRVVSAALRETENLSALVDLSEHDVATSRGLSTLFDDCLDQEVIFGTRESLARLAQCLADESANVRHRDVLTLANVLLSHVSFEYSHSLPGTVPRAWFLNLETLFQTAVLRVLRSVCAASIQVDDGVTSKPAIFSNEKRKYRAVPDLVLRDNGTVLAIGDVKYKDLTKKIKQSDLYQLLVHAAAFKAPRCFLIYPGDRMKTHYLGESVTGCQTWVFSVDVRTLPASISGVAGKMNLPLAVR
jgi:5-methylcytosine-specific restriction endonuclease McrBC regulatory subunit McrC